MSNLIKAIPAECARCDLASYCQGARRKIELTKNQVLCYANLEASSFFMVLSGVFKVTRINAEGEECIDHFYFPGELIGFEALENKTYPQSIVAVKRASVCEIQASTLLKFLSVTPIFQLPFLKLMSKRLNASRNLARFSAEERMCYFLLDLLERIAPKGERVLVLPISRELIGHHLGLAMETVSRLFSRFQKRGWIRVERQSIWIIDAMKLRGLS